MTVVFSAYTNEDNVVLDTTYLADPFDYKMSIYIKNQSTQTLYFKVVSGSTDWTITSPTNGELGSIGAATGAWKVVTLQRAKPTTDVTETVPLTIEVYTDSGYTNKVDQATLNINFTIANLRAWQNVTIYDFEDGTSQGWTLGSDWSVSSAASVEAGGYSLQYYKTYSNATWTSSVSLSTTLPNNAQVVLNLLMAAKFYSVSTWKSMLYYLKVKVNGNDVFVIDNMENMGYYYRPSSGSSKSFNWVNIGADLSAYAGQSVTIDIELSGYMDNTSNKTWVWLDDIIIAGQG